MVALAFAQRPNARDQLPKSFGKIVESFERKGSPIKGFVKRKNTYFLIDKKRKIFHFDSFML